MTSAAVNGYREETSPWYKEAVKPKAGEENGAMETNEYSIEGPIYGRSMEALQGYLYRYPERFTMKQKMNARERRQAEEHRRKSAMSAGHMAVPAVPEKKLPDPKPVPKTTAAIPVKSPEEEAREFLEYLERYGVPSDPEDVPQPRKKKAGNAGGFSGILSLNLEDGMPVVSDAVRQMHIGIQEMRVSRVRVVKLIHGYGSTGRGGKLRIGIRQELAAMKRRGLIREFIPGEAFGPMDAASRKLTETERSISRDPDYGRINQGITIVVL